MSTIKCGSCSKAIMFPKTDSCRFAMAAMVSSAGEALNFHRCTTMVTGAPTHLAQGNVTEVADVVPVAGDPRCHGGYLVSHHDPHTNSWDDPARVRIYCSNIYLCISLMRASLKNPWIVKPIVVGLISIILDDSRGIKHD